MAGSGYIKLPKELDHPRKRLINIQNIDHNECFKWCLVRYLHLADHYPARIAKGFSKKKKKDFSKILDFKDIKTRDIHKIEKKIILSALVILVNKIRKNIQSMYQKNVMKINMLIYLLIGEEDKKHYVLMKDFNTFMCNHKLSRGRNYLCLYCLQAFSTEEILKGHIKDCFNINGKQRIEMPKISEYVTFKNYERNIKLFMIYADFENILVPEDSGSKI